MDNTMNTLMEKQIEQCKPWITEMARRHGLEDLYQEVWVQCLQLGRAEVDWAIPQHDRIRAIARRQWLSERRKARRRPQAFSECSVDPSRLPDQDDAPQLERLLHDFVTDAGIQVGQIIHALRVAVTGKAVGFGLFETLAVLGRERVVRRIDQALAKLTDSQTG